ncbi:MAG: bifunctional folylpolyglutamate synthase/dihydrofolate synthase [Elusimicrobiaceae bacterium]|nr:bifunctional folylpolyglutamate synthase/dihydrofolate synthase [Elusimicrobiaceae bacterium]
MNFNQWFLDLQTRTALNSGAGLSAFIKVLDKLKNPQQNYKIVHVAGTNGKGTVCTLLAHTLVCAGKRTGLFVSPHLQSPTERIQINGQAISEQDFKQAVQTVLAVQENSLNLFELLTAAALVYFAWQQVQYVVLETGLGGRKDPTNVCTPVLSIITSIGLDHTQLLGNSEAQIATEKAGIIKPGVPVICGEVSAQAAAVIEQAVAHHQTTLTWVREGNPFYSQAYDFVHGFTILRLASQPEWKLRLLGEKQAQNACIVYHAAKQLGVAKAAIQTAFETVNLPGRFECIQKGGTTFVLDGAHNPQAVANLMQFWQKTPYAAQNPALLCGFMKDKDLKQMLPFMAPHFQRVIVTVPTSPRGAKAEDFGDLLNGSNITFEPDYKTALALVQKEPVVLCAGSFYLVGAVRECLLS